jgi:hypothetical protein
MIKNQELFQPSRLKNKKSGINIKENSPSPSFYWVLNTWNTFSIHPRNCPYQGNKTSTTKANEESKAVWSLYAHTTDSKHSITLKQQRTIKHYRQTEMSKMNNPTTTNTNHFTRLRVKTINKK